MRFGWRPGSQAKSDQAQPPRAPAPPVAPGAAQDPSTPDDATPDDVAPDLEPAEPAEPSAAAPEPAGARPIDLRLARVHLRTGALALARAELEMLAGQDRLDIAAMVDLAEARWRTADLVGAAEAANAYLGAGGDEALGFVIAAEAAAAQDRPAEARRLAGRALERSTASLESIFAGMPRSQIWPHDAWSGEGQPQTEVESRPSRARTPSATAGQAAIWDASGQGWTGEIDVTKRLEAARAAIESGDFALAAFHLGVVIRFAPRSADDVLDVIDGFTDANLEIVRGDALRLVGSEWEARRAFIAAARAVTAEMDGPASRGQHDREVS